MNTKAKQEGHVSEAPQIASETQAGVPLHTVGEILGHSSLAVTKRYAHLAPEHLAEAMRRIA